MNEDLVRALAYISAENAKVASMLAENQARVVSGRPPAYTEQDFWACEQALVNIGRHV